MKQKLLLLALLAQFCSLTSFAYYNAYIDGIYYILSENGAMVFSADDKDSGTIVIPENVTYEGTTYIVTSIGGSAFQGRSGLTSIIIPKSVTSIGEYNQEIKGETNVEIIPVSA